MRINTLMVGFIMSLLFFSPSLWAAEPSTSDSRQQAAAIPVLEVVFVKDMTSRGLAFLSDEAASLEDRKADFRQLLRDSFDMKAIGQFAVGIHWKRMSDAQKEAYLKSFEDYIVNVYSRRFEEYNGQVFEFKNKVVTIGNDVMVTSDLVPKSGEKIRVDWRVRHKDGGYKIIDIVVAGVSMSITQRSDFGSTIQRSNGNVDTLISHLQKLNAKAENPNSSSK